MNEGIDAVIVDSVLKIRNGLTKNANIKRTHSPSPLLDQVKDDLINGVDQVTVPGFQTS